MRTISSFALMALLVTLSACTTAPKKDLALEQVKAHGEAALNVLDSAGAEKGREREGRGYDAMELVLDRRLGALSEPQATHRLRRRTSLLHDSVHGASALTRTATLSAGGWPDGPR